MQLDPKFSRSRTENERIASKKIIKKKDKYIYGEDGYAIGEYTDDGEAFYYDGQPAEKKKPVHKETPAAEKQKVKQPAKKQQVRQQTKQPEKKPVQKKKSHIGSGFLWVVLLVAAAAFAWTIWNLPMFSTKVKLIACGVLGGILLITGAATSIFSPLNLFQKFVNTLLAVCMALAAVLLPKYTDKVTELMDQVTGDHVRICLYALTEEYKTAHASDFKNTIEVPEPGKSIRLAEYTDAVYGTFTAIDRTNQEYAISEIEDIFNREIPYCKDYNSARQCADALYNNEVDIMIMSESYASFIEEVEGYETFTQDTQVIYTFSRKIDSDILVKTDANLTQEPYTIFFGGNDEEGELSIEGRTDVDMLVSVNPQTGQIAIINMPRDSFIPNPAYNGREDKLTHLGVYGLDNTLEGLGDYLDVDIDYYVLVNFTTFKKIIEALGGVDVDNPYAFDYTWDDYSYPEGKIHLDGQAALYYVRERYNLPDGDFGRSMHQQLVMKAIINKLISPALLTNFNGLMEALDGTFLTNLSSSSLYGLCQKQLDDLTSWNIVNYHVTGDFGMEYTASDPYNQLSVVYPYENQVEFVQDVIDAVYNGEILEQEEMPDGY